MPIGRRDRAFCQSKTQVTRPTRVSDIINVHRRRFAGYPALVGTFIEGESRGEILRPPSRMLIVQ
jgi:hypothetical protein